MPNPPTAADQWFDEYLADHGYTFTVEPGLGIPAPDDGLPKLPDRLIDRAGVTAICEVKEFTEDAMSRRWPDGGSQFGTFSSQEWFLSVGRAITDAARQLEPLADDQRPLVIVLANPHGVAVDLAGPKLMEAMQGGLTIQIPLATETGQPTGEPLFVLGEDGRLAGEQLPWVSAVVGLHRGDHQKDWLRARYEQWKADHWPDAHSAEEVRGRFLAYREELEEALQREDVPTGHYFYADAVEAVSATAVPLPRNMFDGERDRRWVVNKEASTWDLLA